MTLLEVEPLLLNWESQEEFLAAKTPFQSLKYQIPWRTRDYYVDLQYGMLCLDHEETVERLWDFEIYWKTQYQ